MIGDSSSLPEAAHHAAADRLRHRGSPEAALTMGARIEAFIISLRDSPSRRSNVDRIRAGCPVPCTVVDAVDGRAMTAAERDAAYRPGLLRPRFPFPLSPAEIGTFLSHRKTWQLIVERKLDAGLVFEDDVELVEPYFSRAWQAAVDSPSAVQILKFGIRSTDRPDRATAVLRSCVVPPLGNVVQLIHSRAARRLLDLSMPFDRPVDTFEQMIWLHRLPMGVVEPSGVREISARLGGTTIHARSRGTVARLARAGPRLRYRTLVRWMSMHHSFTGKPFADEGP